MVAASNACGQSGSIDPTFIIVTGTPGMPGPISGPTFNVCPDDVVNYSIAPVLTATSYSWTVPANAQITSGQGTTAITMAINGGFAGGPVCVSAVNDCGTGTPTCINIVNGDQDNDGDPDCLDNCPFVHNPNQRDRDNDGLGDVCDPCNNNQSGGPCNDGDPCTTNDVYDASCVCHGTFQDSDSDGVCDAEDQCPGFDDNIDSDGDSVADGCDECPGFDDLEDDNNNGIPDGCDNCTVLSVDAGTCQVVYRGWNPLKCTDLTANPLSGTAPYTYLWNTGANTQIINVCPVVNTVYTVTVTDAGGCTGTDVVTVEVVDVRCGPNNADVKVCHSGTTLCVKANKVQSHLNHGDALGDCGINPCSGIYAFAFPGDFLDYKGEELPHDHMNQTDETELLEDISVYPNPATNEFIIQCIINSDVTVKWRMVDMQGREMMNDKWNVREAVNIKSINISGITPGLYLIQVVSGDIHFQTKLVIAR